MPEPTIKMITPPLQPGHPCAWQGNTSGPLTLIATHGDAAWVLGGGEGDWPETCAMAELTTLLPDVPSIELTPVQMDDRVKRAKLAQVQHLVKVIAKNDQASLDEILYRLTNAFKGRIIMTPGDEATPQEMAQGLLVSVLMAAIEVAA